MSVIDEVELDPKVVNASRAALVEDLREFLPTDALLYDPESLKPYECDGLSAYRRTPMAVALPSTIEQVQRIMRVAKRLDVPVVARGAGTGLSGGALPLGDGLLLSLAKFNQIKHIDQRRRTARVQPGVRNLAISEAAAPYGCITRLTLRLRSPAPSAVTLPKTPAGCTA